MRICSQIVTDCFLSIVAILLYVQIIYTFGCIEDSVHLFNAFICCHCLIRFIAVIL